jgi:hypothetical protein
MNESKVGNSKNMNLNPLHPTHDVSKTSIP